MRGCLKLAAELRVCQAQRLGASQLFGIATRAPRTPRPLLFPLIHALLDSILCVNQSFTGVAHVGYIPSPDGRITGLSKLARLVDAFARRPQVQARLTTQVADSLMRILEPRGAIVVVECEHLCMSMRGIRKPGARTITSAVRGQLRDPTTRAEAMSLIVSR